MSKHGCGCCHICGATVRVDQGREVCDACGHVDQQRNAHTNLGVTTCQMAVLLNRLTYIAQLLTRVSEQAFPPHPTPQEAKKTAAPAGGEAEAASDE
jgi:late competence protein required for DNA uptake (superfamily II DNA/RNA helicase)